MVAVTEAAEIVRAILALRARNEMRDVGRPLSAINHVAILRALTPTADRIPQQDSLAELAPFRIVATLRGRPAPALISRAAGLFMRVTAPGPARRHGQTAGLEAGARRAGRHRISGLSARPGLRPACSTSLGPSRIPSRRSQAPA